ncbi:MAG: ribulokinase [Planctomycetota bacterium]|nr:ribulokinase [Planctomycetota bacterium]
MTTKSTFSIGVDYGTNSVRAVVVDTTSGEEIAASTWAYRHGTEGVILSDRDPNVARQHPQDYLDGFEHAVRDAVRKAISHPLFSTGRVVGIGVDSTGSTPLPVDRRGVALALLDEFRDEPAAMAWLWKDHTSHEEAAQITKLAGEGGYPYLAKCGGTYSSEWYWAKALHCERSAPRVAAAAYSWVELCDYVVGAVTNACDPHTMSRGICAAGHKAMYHASWGGLPAAAFLDQLQPGFSRFRTRYAPMAVASDHSAGGLTEEWSKRVGLGVGVPVAVGAFDAHMGAVGAGIKPGTLVKIIGTSTCDCMVWPLDQPLANIPGVCGIVPESVMPGMYGIEAGQSAVGDIFNWCVQRMLPGMHASAEQTHEMLTNAAAALVAGESGLLALDWHNGNRTILVDPLLTGLVVGQTLATTPAELYRAYIEATAFGALTIIDRIESAGVQIREIVACGGIAQKNPLVMQIYANITGRPIKVSASMQTCALGAAIFGAVVGGAHPSVASAQAAMCAAPETVYRPEEAAVATYRRLYRLYALLHDAFGVRGTRAPLDGVMKELISIRQTARAGRSS